MSVNKFTEKLVLGQYLNTEGVKMFFQTMLFN